MREKKYTKLKTFKLLPSTSTKFTNQKKNGGMQRVL